MRGNYYGTLSDDFTTITLEDENAYQGHGGFGPMGIQMDGPVVLTVEGNTLKVASCYSGYVVNYVATNPNMAGGEPEEPEQPEDQSGIDQLKEGNDWSDMWN